MVCRNCGWDNAKRENRCTRCGTQLIPAKKNKWLIPLLSGLLIICVAAVVIAVILAGTGGSGSVADKYARQLAVAQSYYESEEYEKAVDAYLKTIEEDVQRTEGYEGAAKSYVQLGQYTNAQQILRQGYKETSDNRLKLLYKRYLAVGKEIHVGEEDIEVTYDVNRELLTRFLNYTYADYQREYGDVELKSKNASVSKMSFQRFEGEVLYENKNQKTFDVTTGIPVLGMRAAKMSVSDLSKLIVNFQETMSLEELRELFGDSVEVTQEEDEEYYLVFEYYKCKIKIACRKDGSIHESNAWNEITALRDTNENGTQAALMGTVISAQDGRGIHNTTLLFREGRNARTGAVDDKMEIKTDSNGRYEIELGAGIYTVQAEAQGYKSEFFEIEIEENENYVDGDMTLVPVLAEGTIRIVLEWGAQPEDLDSHLDGTASDGSQVSVDYTAKSFSRNGMEYASLDLDDTSAYGPETITLNDGSGSYVYSVEDYTNQGENSSTALSASGATVKVYQSGQADPVYYNVPQGAGTKWEVFTVQNGQITPINRIN